MCFILYFIVVIDCLSLSLIDAGSIIERICHLMIPRQFWSHKMWLIIVILKLYIYNIYLYAVTIAISKSSITNIIENDLFVSAAHDDIYIHSIQTVFDILSGYGDCRFLSFCSLFLSLVRLTTAILHIFSTSKVSS